MTYEESKALEIQQNKERYERQVAVLSQVNLGEGWVYTTETHADYERRGVGKFVNASLGAEVNVTTVWNAKDTFHVFGSYPRCRNGQDYVGYNERRPTINVSSKRTAKAIASDITRRFLPDYLPLLAQVQERIRGNETRLDTKSAIGQALQAAFPVLRLHDHTRPTANNWRNDRETVSLDLPYNSGLPNVSITCHTQAVSINVSDLPLDKAKAVLAILITK